MGFARQIAALLFIVALPVALITTTVRVVLNEPRLYEYVTDEYNTTATTGIERSELLRASGELRDYFNNSDESIFVSVQRDGGPISLFNPRETAHLRDVKALFQLTFRVQEVAVLFVLAYVVVVFIWAKESSIRSLAKQVLTSGLVMLVVVSALGVVAVVDFHGAWDQFHVIAFSNDFWKLDPSRDHLIQMFPEPFWQDVSIWVGLGTLAEIGTLGLLSAIYLRATRSSRVSVTLPAGVQPFS
ncbi:MAG: TIGR01906 family membrane protein [Chloroflexi bacterium]|nr:TIGR01906 family membrane protein [Chloroflexota bacterium]